MPSSVSQSRDRMIRLAGVLTLTASVAACAGNAASDTAADSTTVAATAAPSAPRIVEVAAGDFFYTMADTIPAGATTFRLATSGAEFHHVQLVRMAEGKTMEDLMSAQHGGPPPEWMELVGGPNAPVPNATTSSVTLDLTPGTYAAICVIPSPDGTPHIAKGMSKMLVVTPTASPAPMPEATAKLVLTDYDFVFDEPLTAGQHVLSVTTTASQPHEVFIAKLVPGATAMQLVEWSESMVGPPPGEPLGGTVGIGNGLSNLVHLDLTPGEYALICFLPDAKDGKPHFVHGMIKQITVM